MNYHDFQLLGLPKLGVLTGVFTSITSLSTHCNLFPCRHKSLIYQCLAHLLLINSILPLIIIYPAILKLLYHLYTNFIPSQ